MTAIPQLPRLLRASATVASELNTAFRAMRSLDGIVPSQGVAERLAAGMPAHADNVQNLGRILVKHADGHPSVSAVGNRLLSDAADIRQAADEIRFLPSHDVPILARHIEPFENSTRDTIDAVNLLTQMS